jgi:hypothetical protein
MGPGSKDCSPDSNNTDELDGRTRARRAFDVIVSAPVFQSLENPAEGYGIRQQSPGGRTMLDLVYGAADGFARNENLSNVEPV